MLLYEFFKSADTPQYIEKDDESVIKTNDVRKVRLTLLHLNRLRISNDVRKFENEQKSSELKDQYAGADDAEATGLE
tara:strand:- start:128 stop:358 length:231 start_codon:yes stop_codon:yes gene_type:complete